MTYQTLTLSHEGAVAVLTLNRPDAYNAMNRAFWQEFPQALRSLDQSGETRVLVIRAEGKHFCAGMDLEIFTQPDPHMFSGEPGRRAENIRRLVLQLQDCFNLLEEVRFPVISAIQGGCIGGALDLVCATDMRYCTEQAFFTVKETEIGMTADLGTLQRLPQLLPSGLARELAYTARKMYSPEALQTGFVNGCFSTEDEMLQEVMAVAKTIAAQSPLAVTGCKQMINYARDHSMADSLSYMATWQGGMFQPNDMMTSFGAKMSGKAPEFEPLRPISAPLQLEK